MDLQKKKKNKKMIKNQVYHIKNIYGNLYEKIANVQIYKAFYLEDLCFSNKEITTNKELEYSLLKEEFSPLFFFELKPDIKLIKDNIFKLRNQIENHFLSFYYKNEIIENYYKEVKYSESESEHQSDIQNQNQINESSEINSRRIKNLNKIEFDYMVKGAKGEQILKYLNNSTKNRIDYIKSFSIKKEEKYNICAEITINNNDIKTKKFAQLYKYACWLNLLYDINNSLDNADDKVKQKYISLLNKINNKYNFLDYRCKTIIMLITNGNKNDYDNLKKTIDDEINDNIMAKEFNNECKEKYNAYFDYFDFKYNNEITSDTEDKVNSIKTIENIKENQNYEFEINYYKMKNADNVKKIEKLNNDYQEQKEKNEELDKKIKEIQKQLDDEKSNGKEILKIKLDFANKFIDELKSSKEEERKRAEKLEEDKNKKLEEFLALKDENYRLKLLLMKNNIDFENKN